MITYKKYLCHGTMLMVLSLSYPVLADDGAKREALGDPWEGMNRGTFSFNLAFDRNISKPVVSVYREIPSSLRRNIDNFLTNLSEPLNTVHGILQLNPKVAFTSFWRFVLNTTFGLGGVRDFAAEQAGLHNMDQDLGMTFGHWGVASGPYLVLPVLGPSSARDTVGKVGDWFLDPVGWLLTTPENVAQSVADGIDERDIQGGTVDYLYYQSLEPYVATRSAYEQHQAFTLTGKGH